MADVQEGIRGIDPIDYIENLGRVADRIGAVEAKLDAMLPVILKMGEMFDAIESAREANPMVARLFGLGASQPSKESRKDRKARLAEIQEMGDESDA